jgi:lipid-binding SYLF domain-containing protein
MKKNIITGWRDFAMTARRTRIQTGRLALFALLMAAASVIPGHAADRGKLEREATAVMTKLYQKYPEARKLEQKAAAILVFPEVYKAGLMIGGETGDGVMRVKGKTVAYYNTSGVSYGLQAGAQKYGYALFIMTPSALKSIETADGFEIGTGPSVVVMDDSMARKTSTTTINKDIYAYIFNQKGLMAGLGIQGNKLTRLEK